VSNIYGMRPREVWFWLGAGFLTVGALFGAVAIAYFTKEAHYSLSTGPQMVIAYIAFVLAFLCFFAGIAGWRPWLRWQRFPNVRVRVDSFGNELASQQTPGFPRRPIRLVTMYVHITNAEADRRVSIRAAYLRLKAKPGSPLGYWQLFTRPFERVERSRPADILKLPLNLGPQESGGGELVFELVDYLETDPEGGPGYIEIHDAISGKMACFPAVAGSVYRRHHELRPTTYEERVIGPKAPEPWYSVIGRPIARSAVAARTFALNLERRGLARLRKS